MGTFYILMQMIGTRLRYFMIKLCSDGLVCSVNDRKRLCEFLLFLEVLVFQEFLCCYKFQSDCTRKDAFNYFALV